MSNRGAPGPAVKTELKTSPAQKNVKVDPSLAPKSIKVVESQTLGPKPTSVGSESSSGKEITGGHSDLPQRDRGSRFTSGPDDHAGQQQVGNSKRESQTAKECDEEANPAESEDISDAPCLHKEKKFSGRCRLFAGNLPNDMSESEFRKLFEPYGELNEVFLNSSRGFGFIRLDTRHHAEDARAALDGILCRGRHVRVRFAAHGAALRVRYLSPHISNEVLVDAFAMFGEVERAIVAVDDRGKPTGEGIVEFARKPAAMTALKRINEGVFLISSNPRPISVELLEQTDENDGLPEIFFQKSQDLLKDREQPPRFAQPGSFEYEFGLKWKTLYQMLHEQQELLKKNFEEEVVKMEMDMEAALLEQHTAMLRQDLMRRQEELRRLEEQTQIEIQRRMDMRRQEEERRRQQGMEMLDMRRHEELLWRQQQQHKQEDEMYNSAVDRQHRVERQQQQSSGQERGSLQGSMLPRSERTGALAAPPLLPPRTERVGGLAPPMQPPPVPPASLGMDRPRQPPSGGQGGNASGGMLQHGMMNPAAGSVGAVHNGDKNVPAGMAQPMNKVIPPMIQQQQQRSRFDHSQQGMAGPGGNVGFGGPGGENPRMTGPPGGRDDYFDPKRMRRY